MDGKWTIKTVTGKMELFLKSYDNNTKEYKWTGNKKNSIRYDFLDATGILEVIKHNSPRNRWLCVTPIITVHLCDCGSKLRLVELTVKNGKSSFFQCWECNDKYEYMGLDSEGLTCKGNKF